MAASTQQPHRDPAELSADLFLRAASTYETRLGNCTVAVAGHLVSLLSPPPPNATVLDNAAGTGALSEQLLAHSPSSNDIANIHAVDSSRAMVDVMASRFKDMKTPVTTAIMDGMDLKFKDQTFDLSITNFGIFFFPSPSQGVGEIRRTLKKGGRAAVTTWKEVGLLPLFYEAQKFVAPAVPVEKVPGLEDWQDVSLLKAALWDGGFGEEEVEISDFETAIVPDGGHEGLVKVLTMHFCSFVGQGWTEGEQGRVAGAAARLVNEREDLFVIDEQGRKTVKMVAWVAICTRRA